jgi:hypothetical protein
MNDRRCTACSLLGQKFQKCSKCKLVHYCSRECQSRDWCSHKKLCQKTNISKDITIVPRSTNPDQNMMLHMNRTMTSAIGKPHCIICADIDDTILRRTSLGLLCIECINIQKSMPAGSVEPPLDPFVYAMHRFEKIRRTAVGDTPSITSHIQQNIDWAVRNLLFLFKFDVSLKDSASMTSFMANANIKLIIQRHITATYTTINVAGLGEIVNMKVHKKLNGLTPSVLSVEYLSYLLSIGETIEPNAV